MINELLVNLVNSVLGAGKRTARGNQAHTCPYCNHHKPKLEINFSENKKGYNPWHCWVCNKKGTRITSLFKQRKAPPEKFEELFKLIGNEKEHKTVVTYNELKLPEEYKKFKDITSSDIEGRQALAYIKSRGITQDDIEKYNIGYCEFGKYANKNCHIVNIGSIGGVQGSVKFPGLSIYSSTKAALANLTECLAEEFKDTSIKINCLALGSAQTEMLEEAFPGYKSTVSAKEMAEYIFQFSISSGKLFNGKIIPVSVTTP